MRIPNISKLRYCVSLILTASFCFCFPLSNTAQDFRIETLVSGGDAAPSGDGPISNLNSPSTSGSKIVFQGGLPQVNEGGLFAFDTVTATLTEVVRSDMFAPNGDGEFSLFPSWRPDAMGNLLFESALSGTTGGGTDNNGLFWFNGSSISTVVREGNAATDGNGNYDTFSNESYSGFNSNGVRIMRITCDNTLAGGDDNVTLYRLSNTAEQIFREGTAVPGGDGVYAESTQFDINDNNKVLFKASLRATASGFSDDEALYTYDGNTITEVWREGLQISPDGNGFIGSLGGSVHMNNNDQILFRVFFQNTSGGTQDNTGLVMLDNGTFTTVAREGTPFFGANGEVNTIGQREIAGDGSIGFATSLRNTSGGTADDRALYLQNSAGTKFEVVREGQAAFDGNGVIGSDHVIEAMLAGGQMIYRPQLVNTNGGNADNEALLITDGIETMQPLRTSQLIGGETLTNIDTTAASYNDFGQITYIGTLSGARRLQIWTPQLHWRAGVDGVWTDSVNWTLSLAPSHVHDVFIETGDDVDLDVDASVRNLVLGDGANETLTISDGSVLDVLGELKLNDGQLQLEDATVEIGTLSGHGLLLNPTGAANVIIHNNLAIGDVNGDPTTSLASSTGSIDLQLGANCISDIELGGLASGEFDQITGIDDLIIDGQLNVTQVNGFSVMPGDEFAILSANNLTGTFDGLPQGALVATLGGTDLHVSYVGGSGTDVVLVAPTVILADVNQDGVVNLLDVAPFIAAVSGGGFVAEADTNLDGSVNLLDVDPFIAILASN